MHFPVNKPNFCKVDQSVTVLHQSNFNHVSISRCRSCPTPGTQGNGDKGEQPVNWVTKPDQYGTYKEYWDAYFNLVLIFFCKYLSICSTLPFSFWFWMEVWVSIVEWGYFFKARVRSNDLWTGSLDQRTLGPV